MTNCNWLIQTPPPGKRILMHRGDTVTFTLQLDGARQGSAWLRTNIGHARILRQEIVGEVENGEPRLGKDWFDAPMVQTESNRYRITLPLCEVGHFEAKAYFLEQDEIRPKWPVGSNTVLNVEPEHTCCANILYNAFVRQFGPNKSGRFHTPMSRDSIAELDRSGYAVIPPSGTFRDLIGELDFIIGELGCRMIQLLPIHPTPTTYGRMGRFGSPYAALSFTEVDPALAQFDPSATPLEQFIELVDAVHARHAGIIIDIAINHTGWAAGLHESHPRWLARDDAGQIEVPGAWGVRWEDLTKLDYTHQDLWQYMAEVFLTWCYRGVDGFRCDAGYMIPAAAWTYMIAKVREQFPKTIFLLEGLGGKISVTRELLNQSNFNWGYSELFQNYDRSQIETYLPEAVEISESDGVMVHFAETHDNPRLAARSPAYARMRTALSALFSHQGAFGFANGVEWFATEKIDVHDAPSLNWGADPNQVAWIRRLNSLLREHPNFNSGCRTHVVDGGEGNHAVLLREHPPSRTKLLILVNLDDRQPTKATWSAEKTGFIATGFTDLLTEQVITPEMGGDLRSVELAPGQVCCLSMDMDTETLERILSGPQRFHREPERSVLQRLRAKALEIGQYYSGMQDMGNFDPDEAARQLKEDPLGYCRNQNPHGDASRTICWHWPIDARRTVMVPPEHFLMLRAKVHFRARITSNKRTVCWEESLPAGDGTHFAIFTPLPTPANHRERNLMLDLYEPEGVQHSNTPLFFLARAKNLRTHKIYQRRSILGGSDLMLLGTNGCGGMLRAAVSWGKLRSRYDALLAANIHPQYPENRQIIFTRCRAWVVFQGYSQEIGDDCLSYFFYGNNEGTWRFRVPSGQGESVDISIAVGMRPGINAVYLNFYRHRARRIAGRLPDEQPVQLILRPDIECRDFHETTKAFAGPETLFPASIEPISGGFVFAPGKRCRTEFSLPGATFTMEPEWYYMLHRSLEAERGLDPDSDLFSPGYFSASMNGGQEESLSVRLLNATQRPGPSTAEQRHQKAGAAADSSSPSRIIDTLNHCLSHYVVRRGSLKSVVAGYPWFLDWGRDSLIVVRGLIAAGRTNEARDVLTLFGGFERDGTLPNMINAQDAGDRDTSDAPLWFFVACSELVTEEGRDDFLNCSLNGRSVREILIDIGRALQRGASNGVGMDGDSGLLFSPSHFTWMDTNHPAGTPREGYPIEIQALWFAALGFLERIDPENTGWKDLALSVRESILKYFVHPRQGYLCDCLSAAKGTAARNAEPDDALRPNQLLALTLGAVNDPIICRSALAACEELLVPGAIRSLADRRVERPLAIHHDGSLLNDPHYPYWGHYLGVEDQRRKPAYHNGTAWTWMFPSFCEAWATTYGAGECNTALAWLGSSQPLLESGCIGHIPEILDGDTPHAARGCDAQAWGASELLRVWKKIEKMIRDPHLYFDLK